MTDKKTGVVVCSVCGRYIGNYLTGDFYKLIRTKYCEDCKTPVQRQQQAFYAREHRKLNRIRQKELIENISLLRQENAELRRRLFGADVLQTDKYKGV